VIPVSAMSDRVDSLCVWDALGEPPTTLENVVLWRSYPADSTRNVVCVPRLIEAHAEKLRTRFLRWTYELGETFVRGRRLVDHLELRPGLSYWWMTPFAEKCNYGKMPQINDAIRLMAFESWAKQHIIRRLVLVSSNPPLAKCFRLWCADHEIDFEWHQVASNVERTSLVMALYRIVPPHLRALIWLVRYLVYRWPLKGVGLKEWRSSLGRISFVSYMFNLDRDAAKRGVFAAQYWAHLPSVLKRANCKTNWLHIYTNDPSAGTPKSLARLVRGFNRTEAECQCHAMPETFLNGRVIFKTLRDWIHLVIVVPRLCNALPKSKETVFDFRPLFQERWNNSLSDQTAMSNLMAFNLFESAMASLPKQCVGVYLQENQGWEFGMIHAWKAAGHGRLVGVPHSTIRYWDLRYFFDPQSYQRTNKNDLPLPDRVAVNGAVALNAYVKSGYPEASLVAVEALRYLHLVSVKGTTGSNWTAPKDSLRVLVLGDYLPSNTELQMRLLVDALRLLPANSRITIKPHPACPIDVKEYPEMGLEMANDPISVLLQNCDVAYTSNLTSAAVDAYLENVPVITVLDPNTLNLSPLRGCDDVYFVSTSEQLARAIATAKLNPKPSGTKLDYFTLDMALPLWQELLLQVPCSNANN